MKSIKAAGNRFPARIIEKWILAWIVCSNNSAFIGNCLSSALEKIRTACTVTQPASTMPRRRNGTDPSTSEACLDTGLSSNQGYAFWMANLLDLASFFQWAVAKVNDSEKMNQSLSETGMTEKLLFLIQMRTDVARLIEFLYRAWLSGLFRSISVVGIAAILDYQGLTGFSQAENLVTDTSPFKKLMSPFGIFTSGNAYLSEKPKSIEDLIMSLDELTGSMSLMNLQPELSIQVLNSLFSKIGAATFNQFLLRKNYASWKRGIQIQYNISRLDEWALSLQTRNPGQFFPSSKPASPTTPRSSSEGLTFGGTSLVLRQMEPLVQAVKLLQLAKTSVATDIAALTEACPRLNLSQIRKILICYVPDAYEDGPVSQEVIKELSSKILNTEHSSTSLKEILPEINAQNCSMQLSIRPRKPERRLEIPTSFIPSQLWKIFTLFDLVGENIL